MRLEPLPAEFYARPVLRVARDCIGKYLVHDTPEGRVVGRIVEAEAYRGPEDRAAHSFGGRRTARTEVMFGPPGRAYVFLVYGLHIHVNLVTSALGLPHAVLLRAVEPVSGIELMASRRGRALSAREPGEAPRELTNGPGKLCQAFGIARGHNGADLTRPPLFLSDGPRCKVARATRVGIAYAGAWAARPWRFYDPASRWVSTLAGTLPARASAERRRLSSAGSEGPPPDAPPRARAAAARARARTRS